MSDFIIENGILKKYVGKEKIVNIPETVKEIGKNAFYDCESLEVVNILEGVEVIGDGAFFECENLIEVNLPSTLKNIEDYAFVGCVKLKKIIIPEGIEVIRSAVFAYCENLIEVSLPSNIKVIEAFAFKYCSNLKKINVKRDVKIGVDAFLGCDALADENGFIIVNEILFGYIGEELIIKLPAKGVRAICSSLFGVHSDESICDDNVKFVILSDD